MDADDGSGSQSADALFRKHASYVKAFLHRLGLKDGAIAEDAMQEVFIIAHKLGGYRPGTGTPRSWLGAITIRVAANTRRKIRRTTTVPIEYGLVLNIYTPMPDVIMIRGEETLRVEQALNALKPALRDVLIGFYIEGKTCHEMAAIFNIPTGTIYSRLFAARKQFEQNLVEPLPAGHNKNANRD